MLFRSAGNTEGDDYPYISVILNDSMESRGLIVEKVDLLDPLDFEITSVTLQSAKTGDLKGIEGPLFGNITRLFRPSSGNYHGAQIDVVENKTIDGKIIPSGQSVYVIPTFPSFTVNVPGKCGNILLIKRPENIEGSAGFTELFNIEELEMYIFAPKGLIYYGNGSIVAVGAVAMSDYSESDLNFTLVRNEVNLTNFCPKEYWAENWAIDPARTLELAYPEA